MFKKIQPNSGFKWTLLLIAGIFQSITYGQNSMLSCHDLVNVSLDSSCQVIVTPDMLLADGGPSDTTLLVEIIDQNGFILSDTLTQKYRGVELTVRVIDSLTNNSCWGLILVEDKHPPIITCTDTVITCFEPTPLFPVVRDNCNSQVKVELLEQDYDDQLCENDSVIGIISRTIQAVDGWNNSIICEQDVILERETLLGITCPADSFIVECCSQLPHPETGTLVDALWSETYADIDTNGIPHPIPVIDQDGNSIGLVDPPYRVMGNDTIFFWQMPNRRCNVHVEYHDHVFPDCGYSFRIKREWLLKDLCTGELDTCIQYITVQDTLPPVATLDPLLLDTVQHTECKAHVEIFSPTITEECGLKFEKNNPQKALQNLTVTYDIVGKEISFENVQEIRHGEIPANGSTHIYLPVGEYTATYIIRDGCYNTSAFVQTIIIEDHSKPVPICKGNVGVTLNPDSCYARVWGYEFDNGSFDNCCNELHFAIANQDTVEYWENYWYEQLTKECYKYPTAEEKLRIHEAIDHWINCFVFNDYLDVWDCGKERITVRIYEACGLPLQDPHIFKGSKHQWFCFNLYDDFACYYKIKYDTIQNYGVHLPRPIINCDFEDLVFTEDLNCGSQLLGNAYQPFYKEAEPNPVCCDFQIDPDHPYYEKWKYISSTYPAFDTICKRRYTFPHKYNDCWFELDKIDKVEPVCEVTDDVTVYCDGLHDQGYMIIDRDTVYWNDITYASNNPHYNPKIYPWNLPEFGYYNGPMNDEYHYTPYDQDQCVSQFLQHVYPKPIYCRFWLLLDQFDRPGYTFDFTEYFAPVYFYDNCSIARVDTVEETHLNDCGNGYISRHYTVYDRCDNSTTCYQKLVVKARSDFEVIFPKDTVVLCNASADLSGSQEALGYPIIGDDDCELVGINFEDQVLRTFEHNSNACLKIIRNWSVIDWCVFNENRHDYEPDVIVDDRYVAGEDRSCVIRYLKDNGDGVIHYQQVIYVLDTIPPQIQCIEPIVYEFTDENCNQFSVDTVLGFAEDECDMGEGILYSWFIDLDQLGEEDNYTVGPGRRVQTELPVGVHDAYLVARDACGNADTCKTTISIIDKKPPTPYCYVGIASVIMQSPNQELTIWANDLDAGSYDNCDDLDELEFAFDEDFLETSRSFSCSELGINDVMIWVRDQSGNKAFCITYIEVQEGNGNCDQDSTQSFTHPDNQKSFESLIPDHRRGTGEAQFLKKDQDRLKTSWRSSPWSISNAPNPFSIHTKILIDSEVAEDVLITITDITGQELLNDQLLLHKGKNEYIIRGHTFKTGGIKYVRVIGRDQMISHRILFVQ